MSENIELKHDCEAVAIPSGRRQTLTIVRSSQGGNTITVQMAMTSPGCGMSDVLKSEVEAKLIRLPEVSKAVVEVVFEPAWNPSRMSEAARLKLDMGIVSSQGLVRISRDR